MNIWIFNHYAVGPKSNGITRHYDLARELVKKGIKVSIFASSFNYQSRKEEIEYRKNEWFKKETIDGIQFFWIRTPAYSSNNYKRLFNMLSYSIKVYKLSIQLNEQPTHIIGSLMHPFAALSANLVAKKKKSIFIFEERDLWPQSMIDLGRVSERSLKVKILRRIEKKLLTSADKVLILFEKAKEYIIQQGIPEKKIMVITNGIDESRFSGTNSEHLPDNVQEKLSTLDNKFVAVYTGAHGMANNLDAVLDAAKILNEEKNTDIHFLFVGDGVHKEHLVNRKKLENIKNATFLEPINKKFIPSLLASVDLGLLPLHDSPVFNWGISPNKMYDYMAASLPVVIMCDIEENVIEKNDCGVVIRKNQSENLAHLLKKWSKNKLLAEKMGKNGQTYVNSHCTWQILSEKFLAELQNIKE